MGKKVAKGSDIFVGLGLRSYAMVCSRGVNGGAGRGNNRR